jgi:transcriptional regulator with XRE-family HTH domain
LSQFGSAILVDVQDTLEPVALADLDSAALVREARQRANISQAVLAKRVGTTQSAVSRWERGHEEPRLARLAAILRACDLRAMISLRSDDGVDRAQIRQQLAMSPEQRLASVVNVSRFVSDARRA